MRRSMPLRSWRLRAEPGGDHLQRIGVRQVCRERQLDVRSQLLDAHGDLDKQGADGREGRAAPARFFRRRRAQGMQQPVGALVQEEPELVGLPAMTRGLVGARVELQILDHVLYPPARSRLFRRAPCRVRGGW